MHETSDDVLAAKHYIHWRHNSLTCITMIKSFKKYHNLINYHFIDKVFPDCAAQLKKLLYSVNRAFPKEGKLMAQNDILTLLLSNICLVGYCL